MKHSRLSLLVIFLLVLSVAISACTQVPATFTIDFDSNGGTEVESIILENEQILFLPSPEKEGYTFMGWFTGFGPNDVQFSNVSPVIKDTTLYAKWDINQYSIIFNSVGGTLIEVVTQDYGTFVEELEDPIKIGYEFMGWYLDASYTTSYSFTTIAAQNITLYAKWDILSYSLRFVDESGQVIQVMDYEYGADLSGVISPSATKIGYTLTGWDIVVPGTMPAENVTIEAIFTKNTYLVQYIDYNNTIIDLQTVEYGGYPVEPEFTPSAEMKFIGWSIELSAIYCNTTIRALYSTDAKGFLDGALPSVGNPYVLAFYITFPDTTYSYWGTPEEVEMKMFSDEFFDDTSTALDSVRSFFYRSSYGKLDIDGDFITYVTQHNNSYYTSSYQILDEVVQFHKSSINWDLYDKNLDNYIDGFFMLFSTYPVFGGPNFVTTVNIPVGNKIIGNVAHLASLDVGTMSHETYHMMGLPDIYATVGVNPNGTMSSSIMDGLIGDIPGISKYIFGWIDNPIIVETIGLHPLDIQSYSEYGEIVIVKPNADPNNLNWFIIEYVTAKGNNNIYNSFGLQSSGGIRIWRTNMYFDNDNKIIGIDDHVGLTNSPFEYLEIVHQEGIFNYFFSEGDTFTPYSALSSYYGESLKWVGNNKHLENPTFSGIYLENITFSDNRAQFTIEIKDEIESVVIPVVFNLQNNQSSSDYLRTNDISIGTIEFDIEVDLNELDLYMTAGENNIPISYAMDYRFKTIMLYVDQVYASLIGEIDYSIIFPDDFVQTYYGESIELSNINLNMGEIVIPYTRNQDNYSFNNYNCSFCDSPYTTSLDSGHIAYILFSKNIQDENPLFTLFIHDTNLNVYQSYVLESPIQSEIIASKIYFHEVIFDNEFFLPIIYDSHAIYIFKYDYTGHLLSYHVIESEYNFHGINLQPYRNKNLIISFYEMQYIPEVYAHMYIRSRYISIDCIDSLVVEELELYPIFTEIYDRYNQFIDYVFIVSDSELIVTSDNSLFHKDGEEITLIDLPFGRSDYHHILYNEYTDRIESFYVHEKQIMRFSYDVELKTFETSIVVEELLTKVTMNNFIVQYIEDYYLISFDDVYEKNIANYQNTFLVLIDVENNVVSSYRCVQDTNLYNARPLLISPTSVLLSRYNGFHFIVRG